MRVADIDRYNLELEKKGVKPKLHDYFSKHDFKKTQIKRPTSSSGWFFKIQY